jgi:hypothetical protein
MPKRDATVAASAQAKRTRVRLQDALDSGMSLWGWAHRYPVSDDVDSASFSTELPDDEICDISSASRHGLHLFRKNPHIATNYISIYLSIYIIYMMQNTKGCNILLKIII